MQKQDICVLMSILHGWPYVFFPVIQHLCKGIRQGRSQGGCGRGGFMSLRLLNERLEEDTLDSSSEIVLCTAACCACNKEGSLITDSSWFDRLTRHWKSSSMMMTVLDLRTKPTCHHLMNEWMGYPQTHRVGVCGWPICKHFVQFWSNKILMADRQLLDLSDIEWYWEVNDRTILKIAVHKRWTQKPWEAFHHLWKKPLKWLIFCCNWQIQQITSLPYNYRKGPNIAQNRVTLQKMWLDDNWYCRHFILRSESAIYMGHIINTCYEQV